MFKKIFIPLGYIIFIGAVLLYFISCSTPEGASGGDGSSVGGSIDAPSSVEANYVNKTVKIDWNSVNSATGYRVYRSIDDINYTEIGNTNTNNRFEDENYVVGDSYYRVKALSSSAISEYSPSASLTLSLEESLKPAKPTVTSFSMPGCISIKWNPDASADSYILYVDDEPDNVTYGTFEEVLYEGVDTYFEHDASSHKNKSNTVGDFTYGKFFYYKLAIVSNDTTSDKSEWAFGIANNINPTEPNNDIGHPNVLYSPEGDFDYHYDDFYNYIDPNENPLTDSEDWYRLIDVPGNTSVSISFIDFTDSLVDETLKCYYYDEDGIEQSTDIEENDTIPITNYNATTDDVYFRIYCTLDVANGNLGNYTVKYAKY